MCVNRFLSTNEYLDFELCERNLNLWKGLCQLTNYTMSMRQLISLQQFCIIRTKFVRLDIIYFIFQTFFFYVHRNDLQLQMNSENKIPNRIRKMNASQNYVAMFPTTIKWMHRNLASKHQTYLSLVRLMFVHFELPHTLYNSNGNRWFVLPHLTDNFH